MFSIICSVHNRELYERMLKPSLNGVNQYLKDRDKPELQVIEVSGSDSLTSNYNRGMKQAKYPLKFFIHEDVYLQDHLRKEPMFFSIAREFEKDPSLGLVGLVGSKMPSTRFWWESGSEHVFGSVLSWADKRVWQFNANFGITDVVAIDGFFMATNKDIEWSEDIVGFHFYDSDYCHKTLEAGHRIAVVEERVWHLSEVKKAPGLTEMTEYYQDKWSLL